MTSNILDYHAVTTRAAAGREAERARVASLKHAYFKASASAFGLAVAFSTEMLTMTTALRSNFEALSTGADLGSELLPIRYGIGGALLLAHVILRDSPDQPANPLRRWLRRFRMVPIAAIMAGMAVFMFSTIAQATGGDDGQSGGLAGMALGTVCAALFSVSFLGSTKAMGMLMPAVRSIFAGRAQRAKVADIDRDIGAAEECRARIATLQDDIVRREQPDALRRKAAEEAAAVIGRVAADAHNIHASRAALEGEDIRPQDVIEMDDAPLSALDQRQAYLKSLNVDFFLNLLKHKEA